MKEKSSLIIYSQEIVSGLIASLSIAPMVAVVDAAIFQNASGKASMRRALIDGARQVFGEPRRFFTSKQFAWIYFVYGGTYVVANGVEQWLRRRDGATTSGVAAGKFAVASATNATLSVAKDRAYSSMFAKDVAASTRKVPLQSLALFFVRDAMTVGAAFTAPAFITNHFGSNLHKNISPHVFDVSVQMMTPLFIQLFNTPLYLLGLDLYNTSKSTTAARSTFIARNYWKTVGARWLRILPSYSVCGVINTRLRRNFGLLSPIN